MGLTCRRVDIKLDGHALKIKDAFCVVQVDIADLKLDRRGSSDSTKLDHHEIVCPTIGAVNVYLQVSQHIGGLSG